MTDFFKEFELYQPLVIVIRLCCAVLAGFFIGFERERHNQPAGLRTHMVLALGASMIMVLSIYIPSEFVVKGFLGDPGRMAAQVISGIGFLGAGAILRFGFNVKGLTTAASIWATTGLGLAFGAGYYFLGLVCTILLIIILYLFDKIEDFLIKKRNLRNIKVIFDSRNLSSSRIIESVKKFNTEIKHTSLTENIELETTEIEIDCKIIKDIDIKELFDSIKSLGHIKKLMID